MKLINQSVEYIHQLSGINGLEKQVERAARTCYKTEGSIAS